MRTNLSLPAGWIFSPGRFRLLTPFLRVFALAMFAVLAAASAASGQALTFSFSGTGNSGSGGNSFNGTGTGTVSPGGPVVLSFTGASPGGNCGNVLQISFNVILNASDSVNLLYVAPVPASLQGSGSGGTLTGNLNVTGGTGSFSGKGGSGTATLTVQLSSKTLTYTMNGSLTLGGPVVPIATVTPSGIVPVFSDTQVVQPGSWISIYGTNLANATAIWNGDFPTSLGNVTVSIDGKLGYLWFVSAGQINLQVPDDANFGCVNVVVNTPNGSVTTSVDLESISPSFNLLDSQYLAAVIPTSNGTGAYGGGTYDLAGPVGHFSYPTRPVKRGEVVELFGVGFGPTKSAVPSGKLFSGAAQTANQVQVFLRNQSNAVQAPVSFAGLIGAGLYQINITVPANAPTGDLSVQATVGAGSNGNSVQNSGNINVVLSVQ